MPEYGVIRNNREVFFFQSRLTQQEREQIEERKHSPEARKIMPFHHAPEFHYARRAVHHVP